MATPASRLKKFEMSRVETERFIGYYASHDCLWNVSSPFYSKREHRQAAYISIAEMMGNGITVDQVPTKISTLRTYYGKELRKETLSKKSGAGTDEVYVSTWEWFQLLDPFLRRQVHQKNTVNNMNSSERQDTDEQEQSSASDSLFTSQIDTEDCPSLPLAESTPIKKARRSDNNSLQTQVLQTLKSLEQRRAAKENSGDMLFAKYIASELTNVTNDRKRQELKIKIQQLIFEAQLDN
ncbi:uncharacterized protein LOC124146397 [Haliotis rufescens]|uniref:uncharacterized protein LOC124146397 n=1 Tax=Haliotis rufescens TaxID=6454 RepID=UPI00201F999F|nr:uncharacterized protein LOC124146397 [Haliotis rufescens]